MKKRVTIWTFSPLMGQPPTKKSMQVGKYRAGQVRRHQFAGGGFTGMVPAKYVEKDVWLPQKSVGQSRNRPATGATTRGQTGRKHRAQDQSNVRAQINFFLRKRQRTNHSTFVAANLGQPAHRIAAQGAPRRSGPGMCCPAGGKDSFAIEPRGREDNVWRVACRRARSFSFASRL